MRTRSGAAFTATAIVLLTATLVPDLSAAEVDWLSGSAFDRALAQPISIYREQAELRPLLQLLSETRRTACVLDRRIDPSLTVSLQLANRPLRDAFADLARQVGAVSAALGSTIIVGREEPLDQLLTLAALRQDELKSRRSTPAVRRQQLARNWTFDWQDLDRPQDILQTIARHWNLEINSLELVPHDLWARGRAVDVDAAEALMLVLGQLDLTFEWDDSGSSVTIVSAPPMADIEKSHVPMGLTIADAISRIRAEFPDLRVATQGRTLKLRTSMLRHERISRLIGATVDPPTTNTEPTPLSRRRFPIRVVRKPVSEVLAALRMNGVDVQYDAESIRAADIDLDTLVSFEFANATADELLTALCAPLNLKYEIEGATVRIAPRGRTER